MDDTTLTAAFRAHKEGQTKFTRRMAIVLADMADTRPMSMVWRLEKLGLLKRGSWDWFDANGGITKAHIDQVRSETQEARRLSADKSERMKARRAEGSAP